MTDLERELRLLAADVDWPATPAFVLRRRRQWWPLAVALAAAVAVAFAVPQSRGALLRFFHVGGAQVERVEVLPRANDASLVAALGTRVSRGAAQRLLGRRFAVPNGPVYASGNAVSTLMPGPVLFTELRTGGDAAAVVKKFSAAATHVDWVQLRGTTWGLWLHGGRHVFLTPTIPPRYAGNTLLWAEDGITYRLEGRGLTRAAAVATARRLLDSGG